MKQDVRSHGAEKRGPGRALKLTSPSEVRTQLEEFGVRPRKELGQNFLIDRNIRDIIIETACLQPDDGVLEIGPGLGVLTERLVEEVRHVTAVEIDERLCTGLRERFRGVTNLELICADILRMDWENLLESGLNKVVANLPYSVGNRVLMKLVKAENPACSIVVTVQREVAERFSAVPGSRNSGSPSVWAQLVYDIDRRKIVSRACFWPKPKVESAIVVLRRQCSAPCRLKDRASFYRLTKHAFLHRRKQLVTILRNAPGELKTLPGQTRSILAQIGVGDSARPSDLSVVQWCRLTNMLT